VPISEPAAFREVPNIEALTASERSQSGMSRMSMILEFDLDILAKAQALAAETPTLWSPSSGALITAQRLAIDPGST
jgi:hypothetical protein